MAEPLSTDELHEQRILECYHQWLEGEAEWSDLVSLIEQRSPEQVARMERDRGLA